MELKIAHLRCMEYLRYNTKQSNQQFSTWNWNKDNRMFAVLWLDLLLRFWEVRGLIFVREAVFSRKDLEVLRS
jgi:hypothetical protein